MKASINNWLHKQLQLFFPTWTGDWGDLDSVSCVQGINGVPLRDEAFAPG